MLSRIVGTWWFIITVISPTENSNISKTEKQVKFSIIQSVASLPLRLSNRVLHPVLSSAPSFSL